MLQKLMQNKKPAKPNRPRALVLSPTRELALQIKEGFTAYGRNTGLRHRSPEEVAADPDSK